MKRVAWRWVVGAALALGAVAVALVGLRRSAFFRVRQVEVVGARFLSGAEVANALHLAPNTSLFDRVGALDDRVLRIPGVRSVQVGRRFPGTLVVRIVEAEPVALTPNEGKLAMMDETGRLLPFDPIRAPVDLPIAQHDRHVAEVLARVRESEPALFASLESARLVRGDVMLETAAGDRPGSRRLFLRAGAGSDAIRALAAVLRDLVRRGRDYDELDGRFTDRVFVRGMTW